MTTHAATLPLTAATDAAALARLRALPAADTAHLLDALSALPSPTAQQDHLITHHRVALSLPALDGWLSELRAARDEARFHEFLAEVSRAAGRAEAFREMLSKAEHIQQVNIALLATHLFDALVARDAAAIENLAHAFADIVGAHAIVPSHQTVRECLGGIPTLMTTAADAAKPLPLFMATIRELQQAHERRELVRTIILRVCHAARVGGSGLGVSLSLIERGLQRDGLNILLEEIDAEVAYLADKGWIEPVHKENTPANRRWRITAAGIDQAEAEGF